METIRQSTGEIFYPWMGSRPTGMIIYLQNEYMAVQLMRDPPAKFVSSTYEGATLEEMKDAFPGLLRLLWQVHSRRGERHGHSSCREQPLP